MTDTWSDWDLDDSDEEIAWTVDDHGDWDLALTQLDCTNGNAVCLFSKGMVFSVPARCKKLKTCDSCRQWAWGRQYEHIGDHITKNKVDRLWVGHRVTDREMSAATEMRRRSSRPIDWAWVNLSEGRTYIATADLTQVRGRRFPQGRMTQVSTKEGLALLGDAYLREDVVRRQTCRNWKIPRRSFLLRYGARLRIQQAITEAFGVDGNAWDNDNNRRLTAGEIIARFDKAYTTEPD